MKKLGRVPKGASGWLPGQVWDAAGLNPTDRLIYAHIYSMCEKELTFFASNAYLARMAGCSIRHVQRSIRILKFADLIHDKESRMIPGTDIIEQRYLNTLHPWEVNPDWTFTLEERRRAEMPEIHQTDDEEDKELEAVA